jgi:hypothetical protein
MFRLVFFVLLALSGSLRSVLTTSTATISGSTATVQQSNGYGYTDNTSPSCSFTGDTKTFTNWYRYSCKFSTSGLASLTLSAVVNSGVVSGYIFTADSSSSSACTSTSNPNFVTGSAKALHNPLLNQAASAKVSFSSDGSTNANQITCVVYVCESTPVPCSVTTSAYISLIVSPRSLSFTLS